jgi:hypothetical protein
MACPICLGNDVFASHRRSVLERGPLTWIGLLPFRCGQCQTRFYRIALKDARRRRKAGDSTTPLELRRSPRWPANEKATVAVEAPDGPGVVVEGVAVNVSMDGVRLRLPHAIPEGSQVRVALEGTGSRLGSICWVQPIGEAGVLHGVRFQAGLDRRGRHARPLRWIRLRRLSRRGMIALIGFLVIATAAYGLVWWLESQGKYRPRYYEPKDVERQIHDLQQDLREVKPPRQP